ncbi:PQQ-binding-like beta-propeller repeat protein [Streptomyces sp. NPDC005538]|uniref:PQQ-binding-like beta-propeller repeat protein n=1 Tax=unclassified Streptomyces TaxID=2593676 RepID=UPI0033B490A9
MGSCAHGFGTCWTVRTGGRPGTPAVDDGVVYVGDRDGYLYAVDAEPTRRCR